MDAVFEEIPLLRGPSIVLEPLSPDHVPGLREAAREGEIYRLWYTQIPAPEYMEQEVERRLRKHAEGSMVPWTVRSARDGSVLGMTTFLNIRPAHRHLEIGFTWLRPSMHGSGANAEMKLLQLTHAFEVLGCIAIEFRAHFHNFRSRRAIAGIGAKQDGILRNHDLWRDGTVRDLVVFSIIDHEWPTVKKGLEERLAAQKPPGNPHALMGVHSTWSALSGKAVT